MRQREYDSVMALYPSSPYGSIVSHTSHHLLRYYIALTYEPSAFTAFHYTTPSCHGVLQHISVGAMAHSYRLRDYDYDYDKSAPNGQHSLNSGPDTEENKRLSYMES